MTYREAFDEVASALDDLDVPDKSFLLEAKAWQHCDGGQPRRTFDWCLWLSAFGWSARASTLGELMRQFSEALPGLVSARARDALGAADFELPTHAANEPPAMIGVVPADYSPPAKPTGVAAAMATAASIQQAADLDAETA